jgi:hypothetical protein
MTARERRERKKRKKRELLGWWMAAVLPLFIY